jgi:predicted PurR-regulated permease PerM
MTTPSIWKETKAEGDFSSVYLILVFAIAALLLIFLIKPMFRQSQTLVKQVPGTGSAGK